VVWTRYQNAETFWLHINQFSLPKTELLHLIARPTTTYVKIVEVDSSQEEQKPYGTGAQEDLLFII